MNEEDDFDPELDLGLDGDGEILTKLPRHPNAVVNDILETTEKSLQALQEHSKKMSEIDWGTGEEDTMDAEFSDEVSVQQNKVFANNYVDLGKVDTIGFDYDYTLVTYTNELLDLIYDMALKRLVNDKMYPPELLDLGLKYDPKFSIRGLAVDKETGWICHVSYTHHVAVAWEGRSRVPTSRIFKEYRGKRALRPSERKKRLKPLNDLFSMAECCLIADTVQFFKDNDIPFCPKIAITDILQSVTQTHISGDFHRLVAEHPERYFEATPHLKEVLNGLRQSGKRLIFVSNSPFWYVDAGMRYVLGENWRESWDAVITSAGKPGFYQQESRPFREVSYTTGRIKFKQVDKLEPGEVYAEGCLRELNRLMDISDEPESEAQENALYSSGGSLASHNVLYIGDSLFADLVDAKREFGWTTAAVTPEVGYEIDIQSEASFVLAQRSIDLLLNALRILQEELGTAAYSSEDIAVLDALERLVSKWRDRQTYLLGNPFGSIFRARYQPSLFAHSLRRYCDLYMSSVSALRNYSPQHRFYPADARLLGHETKGMEPECWALEDVMSSEDSFNE